MTKILNYKKYHLRDHPKLRYHGVPTWPPNWGGTYKGHDPIPQGEIGILRNVEKIEANSFYPDHLFLTVEYNGNSYTGGLWIEDSEFFEKFFDFLKKSIGKKTEEIGKMEIWE